ncbi:hypothetical protein ATCC90586_006122 [Pythium insidiosum]|nr:hypothetical protein ATCC90586_006122 [Pythium insidiosum]
MAPTAPLRVATCSAPTNIATIKYWGKDDVALNTPLNSSVSVTLDQDDLRTTTTIAASPAFETTELWLNGKPQALNKRVLAVLREMRALAQRQHGRASQLHEWPLRIVSENSFPTAAGLASSAAGYACLVATLAELYQVQDEFPGQLSTIARQGSGSACRSLHGGFVRWEKGARADGRDSRAVQVADEHHWSSLCAIICVVNDAQKDTSSTAGMQTSRATSELLQVRARELVAPRLAQIEAAYRARDFATFGSLTMQDSNQFHAVCLDTMPPIVYMNDVSRRIVQLVHRVNAFLGGVRVAYTFDAGPNAVLFVEAPHVADVVALLTRVFPGPNGAQLPVETTTMAASIASSATTPPPSTLVDAVGLAPTPGGVKMLYVTRVGGGPRVLSMEHALVDPTTGEPRLPRAVSQQQQVKKATTTTKKKKATTWALAASLLATTALLSVVRRRS